MVVKKVKERYPCPFCKRILRNVKRTEIRFDERLEEGELREVYLMGTCPKCGNLRIIQTFVLDDDEFKLLDMDIE